MAGAGTDKTRSWIETPGPIIVLVEPQLGENIGAAARVMANFGLARLRLVKPRDGWPNIHARRAASGADRILDATALYDGVEAAIADCTAVLATARRRRRRCSHRAWPPARTWRCCSGANATASRTTRSRSPTAS
jgi:tRNA/rRNA methyltransferase